jgi:hypothetical protein
MNPFYVLELVRVEWAKFFESIRVWQAEIVMAGFFKYKAKGLRYRQ